MFHRYLGTGGIVIDVGANQGFVATIFASIVGPKGRVFSFEPSKRTFSKLLKTILVNGLDQIKPYNLACGREACTAVLNAPSLSSGMNTIVGQGIDPGRSEEIEVVALDSVDELWESKVDLLKMDAEGYEPEVLLGAKGIISTFKPVICIELGRLYLQSSEKSLRILEELGYETTLPDDVDWRELNVINVVFMPRDP